MTAVSFQQGHHLDGAARALTNIRILPLVCLVVGASHFPSPVEVLAFRLPFLLSFCLLAMACASAGFALALFERRDPLCTGEEHVSADMLEARG